MLNLSKYFCSLGYMSEVFFPSPGEGTAEAWGPSEVVRLQQAIISW